MKTTIIFYVLFLITSIGNAQRVEYKIVKNDPELVPEKYINIELLGGDFSADFNDGGVYVGANGFWKLTDKFKGEGLLRLNVLNLAGSGFGFQTEAGVFMSLINKNKNKDVPVILSTTLYAGETEDGRHYDETKFVNVDGTYKDQYGARGGLYLKKSGFVIEENSSVDTDTNYTLFGAYLGFEKISQAFVEALVNGRSRYGQGRTRMYVDVLLLPVKSIANDAFEDVADEESSIGWRAGFQWQKKPVEGESWFKPVYSAELGSRPFGGFYLNMSIGITLLNY